MNHAKISAAIIARDESSNIADAIKSLHFADQIVVADTGSSDNTAEIARHLGAEVHGVEFQGFGNTKNKALDSCRGDWVLFIDADERVTPELAQSITRAADNNSSPSGFMINRLTYFLGKPVRHSGWYPDYILRFFKRQNGRFTDSLVHEQVRVDGDIQKLDGLLLHYSYKSIEQYIDKLNEYSTLSAREMFAKGKRISILDILIRPVLIFLKMYIFRAGFLDGRNGLILAALSSYHVFTKYSKLYHLHKNDGLTT